MYYTYLKYPIHYRNTLVYNLRPLDLIFKEVFFLIIQLIAITAEYQEAHNFTYCTILCHLKVSKEFQSNL